ncbi:serine/threonine-protein kinase [Labedaea rhizosphaerae]|uniref:non-specific serine/threonine protein kinase n=1 Tax=Labedaea rhizosphaerae TaxID=598644 RepID=A0A4R6S040_LABRH|nr:serine/threonine-protein kinase [Labedaea rhizosphaerae]TDP92841.1 serine/threonine protein kinase [Labedaea rhizosphaerae]
MAAAGDLVAERYRLLDRIGGGAMSEVWRGHDEVLNRDVAVKELLVHGGMTEAQTQEAHDRALREARIAARLHHPHAVGVFDVVEHAGRPCLIMEFLSARTLADLIAEHGTLPADQVRRIGAQIAGALAAAHAAGIVHRDVKPGNVLITEDGTAKLTDFGISRAVGDVTLTATGVLAGTPAYLAPEVAKGSEATQSSDVFSLGATLYCAIEGAPPFGLDANPIALLYRIATSPVPTPSQADGLGDAVATLLRTDPDQRPTAREAERTLADAEPHPPAAAATAVTATAAATPTSAGPAATAGAAAPATAVTRSSAPRRRRAVLAALAVAVLLIAGVLVAVLTNDNGPDRAAPPGTKPAPTTTTAPRSTTAGSTTSKAGTSTTSAPSSAPAKPPTPQDVPAQLTAAIVDYYQLVPGNLDVAWNHMTADYQQNHAGGRSGYQRFWQAIARVTVTDVTPSPPHTVTATVNYYYRSGNVAVESTRFGLVQENGMWKIASSTVLSHRGASS